MTHGSEQIIEQITKQLNKLIDVVRLLDLSEGRHIERELLLLKVIATGPDREEIKRLVDIFRGRIIDVDGETYTIELTGPGDKLNAFMDTMPSSGIVEVVRSGVSGIARWERALKI